MFNHNPDAKNLTLSEQIIREGLNSDDPLTQQLAAAMMTENPLNAVSMIIEPFLGQRREHELTIFTNFCSQINSGEYDAEVADLFILYRPGLSRTEVESWTITEDDSYWFINTIEKLFEKLHPEIPLNSYFAYPDKRISNHIPFSTIQRIIEVFKTKLPR